MRRHTAVAVVCLMLPALIAGAQEFKLGELIHVKTPTGARIVLDPERWPTSYNEAPMLAERVGAGELPAVEQRLPDEPLVLDPLTIGTYGGSITTGFLGSTELMNRIHAMDKYVYWNVEGTEIIPSVARAHEFSDDGRVLTFRLREGMKWSDGSPFTSKETDFWWNHVYWNEELNPNTALVLETAGRPLGVSRSSTTTPSGSSSRTRTGASSRPSPTRSAWFRAAYRWDSGCREDRTIPPIT